MANDILKYTSKDYDSIKTDLIESISALSETWTSRDDGDPGIVLVKLMSALGDMLSFNMDKQALEYYAPTVTQRKNAARLFELVGYPMHWYRSAKTTLTLTNRAPVPDYIEFYQNVLSVFNENPYEYERHFYSYYSQYVDAYKVSTEQGDMISFPPDGYPLPSKQTERISMLTTALDVYTMITSIQTVYPLWQDDNTVGLHTYIDDPNRTLGVYSTETSSITYTLVPTTAEPDVDSETGQYKPTINLLPYVPTKVEAIQGFLCETFFTDAQLKDNRFYVPDSSLDEEHMYLCYITTNETTQREVPIFLQKTDNLLTITDFGEKDEEGYNTGKTIVYFQFGVDEFDFPYIEIASYWRKVITEDSVKFKFYYVKTDGKYGNISNNYLSNIDKTSNFDVSVSNTLNTECVLDDDGEYLSIPGSNPETARDAYINSLNYIMTYNTIVTIYDFTRFLKRQQGVSNGFACDIQYANDLNKKIMATCSSYTRKQLIDILGKEYDSSKSDDDLVRYLYNIRKICYDYRDCCLTISEAESTSSEKEYSAYTINLYPIWNDFETVIQLPDIGPTNIAQLTNEVPHRDGESQSRYAPYQLYHINTKDEIGDQTQKERYCIQTMLDEELRKRQIVNVSPEYTACRVFDWRCCGTLHLTNSVSLNTVETIIANVVNALKKRYSPQNLEFGQKITYMEVIDTILQSDSRIRYFDAGIGNKKLIDYEVYGNESDYYNIEAYFNPTSIMRYVQTLDEILKEYEYSDSDQSTPIPNPYYHMIWIDPAYIQESNQR